MRLLSLPAMLRTPKRRVLLRALRPCLPDRERGAVARRRVQVYHNFMTAEECDHLVNISRPLVRFVHLRLCRQRTALHGHAATASRSSATAQMRRSTVVGEGGKSVLDTIRTSRGTFLRCAVHCPQKRPEQGVVAYAEPDARLLMRLCLVKD